MSKKDSKRNRYIASGVLVLFGLALFLSPLFGVSFAVLSSGDSLDRWKADFGSISLDNVIYYDAPSSVAWKTNLTESPWNSYLAYYAATYGQWLDWRATPIFRCRIYPHLIPSGAALTVQLITSENGWREYNYPDVTSSLTPMQWNEITVDLRNSIDGVVNLQLVWGIRFHWSFGGLTSDFQTNVDALEILPAGNTYTLTVQATTGGTLDPPAGTHYYAEGSTVVIKATPDNGYVLDHFVLDGVNVGKSVNNDYTLTMDADHTISAVFTQSQTTEKATLIISASAGGRTTPVPGTYQYDVGTTVTITAIPDAGYVFVRWASGSTSNPMSITLSSATTYNVEAIFQSSTTTTSPLEPIQWVGVGSMAVGGVLALPLGGKRKGSE